MTTPTLIVEIGFTAPLTGTYLHIGDSTRGIIGTATIAPDNLISDVSKFVTDVKTRRGATRADGPYLRYEAGSLTIRFRNDDRRFDPTNLSGPYVVAGVTQVEPMRAVQIRATFNGRTYPLWRGFTDEWSVGYDGPDSSWAQVTCFDAFGVFAAQDRAAVPAVGAGEDSGQRISRILNALSWPVSDKLVSNGDETVQATTLAGNVLTELLLTADTELGELWMDAQGRVIFRARSASYSEDRSRYPVAHFGDEPSVGATTVNLVTNPSLETGISGWVAAGSVVPTLAQSAVRARFGSNSLLVTWGTGGFLPNANYDVSGLSPGRVYTISVYVWVPTGSPRIDTIVAGTGQFGSSSSVFDAWERLTWTGTASATSMGFQLWPRGSTTAGQQVWVDGLQVEVGVAATDYVDGDQPGCEWDGVAPHASTSRRLPELPYADTALAYDALSIVNQVRAARAGGTEQVASDPASLSSYLVRTHTRNDLIMQTDAAALRWAEQIVARTAQPELRFRSVTLKGSRDPDRLWPQAFGREVGDRVRMTRRPPGGGDPIVRECWVRGVEHELTVDLDWRTTFVLEQARDTLAVTDGFGRTVSNGWASADGNVPWTTSGGTAADFSVSGGVGRHAHPSVNVLHISAIELGGVNQSISVDITCPVVPTGAAITLWVAGRYSDSSNHYLGRLNIAATTGTATVMLFKRVAGALSSGLGTAAAGTHSAGNTWRLQLDVLGTTVRVRTWRPGVDAMPDWQLVIADSDLSGGTQVAVMSRRETGNTNASPVITFDTFSASTRGAWD